MIDSFFTFSTGEENVDSPGYLSKLRAEMFRHPPMEAQNYGFAQPQDFQFMVEMMPRENNFEGFDHTSAYSTNPSTKDSPEHTPDSDEHSLEDDKGQLSKVPPIVRKGIRKYYEPILDNNIIYKYEDDPNEYRKARKRIQNRESATRVRNRKKNHVEILEDEITGLKKLNAELKAHNSALVVENNTLKNKIRAIEGSRPRISQDTMIEMPGHSRHETDSLFQFMDKNDMSKIDEDLDSSRIPVENKYIRTAPNHKFKRHMALLGVFTLLLCVYGLLPKTETGAVQLFASPKNIFNTQANTTPSTSANQTLNSPQNSQENDFTNEEPDKNFKENSSPDDHYDTDRQTNDEKFENNSKEQPNEKSDHPMPPNSGKFDHPMPPKGDRFDRPMQPKDSKFEEPINENPEKSKKDEKFEPFQGPGNKRPKGKGRPNHPPPKGFRNRFKRFENEKSQGPYTITISLFSAIEILVVLCYSLYLIYVAVSAYKLHMAKKRQSMQSAPVSRTL